MTGQDCLFSYFPATYTAMFLLAPGKAEDRTDPSQGTKKFPTN